MTADLAAAVQRMREARECARCSVCTEHEGCVGAAAKNIVDCTACAAIVARAALPDEPSEVMVEAGLAVLLDLVPPAEREPREAFRAPLQRALAAALRAAKEESHG